MKKTTYIIMALAAVMFAAAGCAKQEAGANGQDCPMSIQPEVVSTDGALKSNDGGATKATLINEAAGLQAQGFGLSIYNDEMAYKDKVTMVYDGGWKPSGGTMDWRWPLKTVYTFYAWSPATLVTDVAASGIQPFTYSGIADQKDIMIGYYSGIGNNGAAPIKFSHALASVQFKTGTITGLGNITKIELSGVITSGTCTPTMSGSETVNFAWSDLSSSTTTLSLEGLSVASASSGKIIGKTNDNSFLVLPQTDKPLTVTLTDNNSKTVTATITAPALTVGHTAVYTINYDGQTASFTVSIENWATGQSDEISFGLPKGALPGEFSVSPTKKVHFSKGNLYAKKTGESSDDGPDIKPDTKAGDSGWTWGFYDNQYDYNSLSKGLTKRRATADDNEIDLFSWGYGPWSTNPITKECLTGYGDYETFKPSEDWGSQIGDGTTWRTLTIAEWEYLFNYDDTGMSGVDYRNDTRAGLYARDVTVMGQAGCLILYPDGYDKAKVVSNGDTSTYNNETAWTNAQNSGVVCLPSAGYNVEDSYIEGIGGENATCLYLSSSGCDSTTGLYAHAMLNLYNRTFQHFRLLIPAAYKGSVRLVTDIQ